MDLQEKKNGEALQVPEGGFVIPREYLLRGVHRAVREIREAIIEAENKYGARYNKKNDYAECLRRFDTYDDEAVLREYELIWFKQSKQPAAVRRTLKKIGDAARQYALREYAAKNQEE